MFRTTSSTECLYVPESALTSTAAHVTNNTGLLCTCMLSCWGQLGSEWPLKALTDCRYSCLSRQLSAGCTGALSDGRRSRHITTTSSSRCGLSRLGSGMMTISTSYSILPGWLEMECCLSRQPHAECACQPLDYDKVPNPIEGFMTASPIRY